MENCLTEPRSLIQKLKNTVKQVSLEPIIFLQAIAWGLVPVIQQNLIIGKVCHDLGYSEDICNDIDSPDNEQEETAVQTRASQINMYISILESVPCSVVTLFIGPWSDSNGRKPVMIIPLIGTMLKNIQKLYKGLRKYFGTTVLSAQHLLHELAFKLFAIQWIF